MEQLTLPLQGYRVVDLSTHLAVPTAGRLMADWGAEVIKVESFGGDEWRILGNIYGVPTADDENPCFTMQNAGKKLVALNLKAPEGKDALLKLLETADVFLCNIRLKSLQKLGLDYESLKERFPRLVYLHFTGYGYEGPDAERPGLDKAAFWAKSGVMADFVGSKGEHPINPLSGFGDATTSSMMLSGVLAALLSRERTGKGTFVTASLYGCALWYACMGLIVRQEPFNNEYPKDADMPLRPLAHFYECSDGEWIMLSNVDHDRLYPIYARILGLDPEDPRFTSSAAMDKGGYNVDLAALMRAAFKKKTSTEWSKDLEEADLVHERIVHLTDAVKDPQAWANDYLSAVEYPSGLKVTMPTNPVQFGKEFDVQPVRNSGRVGRDTEDVLAGIGYSAEQLAALKESGAIK